MTPPEYCITFQPMGRRILVPAGTSLLAAAQAAGIGLISLCGGDGTCARCKVRWIGGQLTPPGTEEKIALTASDLEQGFRLACQAFPVQSNLGPVEIIVEVPPESLSTAQRLQIESEIGIIEVAPSAGGEPRFGLAVDVGTTKLAAYLCDLNSGKTLAQAGAMNPQTSYGEDIISRIAYAQAHPDGRQILHHQLIASLNQLVAQLCKEASGQHGSVAPEQIAEAVVVGNTAMHHFFADLPVSQLGVAPYLPATNSALQIPASELGLTLSPQAIVYLPPNIAGFIGADHVAMLLASGLAKANCPAIALDIGTNTEIALAFQNHLLCCSCASGPAFEGAHIQVGMRAAPGAIEHIQVISGEIRFQTIDHQPPAGICGSGILDGIAAMLACGAIDRRGTLSRSHPLIHQIANESVFLIVPQEAQTSRQPIFISRRDVYEIQLAKAAIRAGIDVLIAEANLSLEEIQSVIISGAFGTYIHIPSAIAIGMFPPFPGERFRQIGNAAGAGARRMLIAPEQRQIAEELARRAEYIELSSHPKFTSAYAKSLFFPI